MARLFVVEDAKVKGNSDGKFFDRLVPSLLAAAIGAGGVGILFWSDTRANDREAAVAIKRLDREISSIKQEIKAERDKTNDLASDVKVLLAITQRIEATIQRGGAPLPQFPR